MSQLFEQNEPAPAVGYAQVALEQGIDVAPAGLTYGIPASLRDLQVGERVVVPFGRRDRPARGFVTKITATCGLDKVKLITDRDRKGVSLPEDLIQLARWMASYYCCPLGWVLASMVPAAVKRGTGLVTRTHVCLSEPIEGSKDLKLTKLQAAVLKAAQQMASEGQPSVEIRCLASRAGARTVTPVKQLVAKGVMSIRSHTSVQAAAYELPAMPDGAPSIVLNDAQRSAIAHLVDHIGKGFSVHLLHGVTGSGKTEVYLRVIEQVIADADRGDAALVLVPEIALTPQTVSRFRARFDAVAVMHSGLTDAQRHEQWRQIHMGGARVVVGVRSAVFAPLPRIGVIIVDEEHDSSYKQDQAPRYHARDIAVRRGQILSIPVLLGSATPSLESYHNATHPIKRFSPAPSPPRTRYHLLELPQRVSGMQLPKVQIIDMATERRHRRGVHLLSRRLEDLLTRTLGRKLQTILLLNRRGYANYIACPDHHCGWMMVCAYCDASMVYHKGAALPAGGVLRCHHCEAEQILVKSCPNCQKRVTVFGLGTQRVEEELGRKFRGARVLRMDSDTMRTSRDYDATLGAFFAGEADVLLGTQMIAKGLDFPNVQLVGVINADTALHVPDFRAAERTFQLIAQVAGRAGRGSDPGMVVVQTFSPSDTSIGLASRHDFSSFARRELQLREKVGLPPLSRMARIVVRNRDRDIGLEEVEKLARHLDRHNRQQGGAVRLRGPTPCPIGRIADYYRQQIEMLAPDGAALQRLTTAVRNEGLLRSDAHTAVDVDPVLLM